MAVAFDLSQYWEVQRLRVDHRLDKVLPPVAQPPELLHEAMRYSLFAGGKRVRPLIVLATGEALGLEKEPTEHVACAIEMIHTYSLVHDDLPCMDNDDFRRGLPTAHRKYGEAVALLAGDALLTRAFQILATLPAMHVDPFHRLAAIAEIARAVGSVDGMIAGQMMDLESEGKQPQPDQVRTIHQAKTASLITACVAGPAVLAGVPVDTETRLRLYGARIGLAFQIVDDILDVEESSAALGKTTGKDAVKSKMTYPAAFGVERSRQLARECAAEAVATIDFLKEKGEALAAIAKFIVERRS